MIVHSSVLYSAVHANASQCAYGYRPYIDTATNALNPCFVALLGAFVGSLLVVCGLWQLAWLLFSRSDESRQFNKVLCKQWGTLPPRRVMALCAVSLQAALYAVQLALLRSADTSSPHIQVCAVTVNLLFVLCVSLPTQYFQYFKSICALGNQLFFYLWQCVLLAFLLVQRAAHWPSDEYNMLPGTLGALLDAALCLNALAILVTDLAAYQPHPVITEYYDQHNMFHTVNVFANYTYTWMNKLITETYDNGKLKDPNHLPLSPVDLNIKGLAVKVEKNWEMEKLTRRNSLLRAIWKTFGATILGAMVLELTKDLLNILEPQVLRLFIKCFSTLPGEFTYPLIHGVFLAFTLFVFNIASTILKNQFFIIIFQAGLGIRGTVQSLVYQKTLRLSGAARADYTTGDILNLLSVDVLRLQRFFENAQTIVGAPMQIVTVLISLYFLLGKAIIGGVVVMVVMIPVNSMLSKKLKNLTKTQMKFKDTRIKTITEILSAMKSIKLYAWEKPMLKKLDHVRNDMELDNLRRIGVAENLIEFAWNCVPLMVSCSSFLIFAYVSDLPLTPELVFPSLSLFKILNIAIYEIPSTINSVIETNVSMERLTKFLLAEEIDTSFIEKSNEVPVEGDDAVEIKNATFLWKSKKNLEDSLANDEEANISSTEVALNKIDTFTAKSGKLTCIVGRVGTGKTTLLKAILGQLPCISGSDPNSPPKLYIRAEKIAYCPQEAWIMNQSIKENILFGRRYDAHIYKRTVKACQLLPDFKIFADGDETMVGEKGISLSGGQKARLALARAVYAQADVYILDDVLSAVDAGVRKNIISQVLDGETGLIRGKTIILATNTLPILKDANIIYVMQAGRIVEADTYQNVTQDNAPDSILKALIQNFETNSASDSDQSKAGSDVSENNSDEAESTKDLYETITGADEETGDASSEDMEGELLRRASFATLKSIPLVDVTKGNRKTEQKREKMEVGRVKLDVYIAYAKACGLGGVLLFVIFLLVSRVFDLAQGFWLKYWSESNEKSGNNGNVSMFVSMYALIGIGSAAFSVSKTIILLIYCSIRASKNLHNNMAFSILRSPMQFFETTPVGRIINRFSTDIDAIDTTIQMIFSVFSNCVLDYLVTILLIGYNMPWFFVFNAFLLVIYYYYQKFYMVQSRELKRLTSVSYSPIMSLMSETLGGKNVISAYDQFYMFIHFNQQRIQNNIDCVFTYRSTNRWLTIRLQAIGAFTILGTALLSLSTVNTDRQLGTGMVGLLMSYVLSITISLTWIVRSSVLLENNVVSVERVLEYCKLTPEADSIVPDHRTEKGWPMRGAIQFKNYSTTYRKDLNPVLNQITLNIDASERVGIVGRTGAGKSSLTLALFRLLEATEGAIFIDGIDISKIGLEDLRSNLAIIPQDAQAFEGTVRYNLDPFDKFQDEELWEAVELAHLKPHLIRLVEGDESDVIPSISDCLNFHVAENGSNLSLGQRQLMCLARALLNKSKILVLDEATAAVDMETDQIIQDTIRSQFKDRTILTIAHRIDTVLDNDKILVLDKGSVKEFDTPSNLLADENSLFYQLCQKGNYLPQKTNDPKANK